MNVGVLAMQGAYNAHRKKIEELGVNSILVKDKASLSKVDALILPGGESTTMMYLLHKHCLWQPIIECIPEIPILATCAGVILLKEMSFLNIDIVRNGYGRQLESGIFPLRIRFNQSKKEVLDGFFIRAPIISDIHDLQINVLSYYSEKPVLIKKGKLLAATFHPELSQSSLIHQFFIEMGNIK